VISPNATSCALFHERRCVSIFEKGRMPRRIFSGSNPELERVLENLEARL